MAPAHIYIIYVCRYIDMYGNRNFNYWSWKVLGASQEVQEAIARLGLKGLSQLDVKKGQTWKSKNGPNPLLSSTYIFNFTSTIREIVSKKPCLKFHLLKQIGPNAATL